MFFGVAHAFLLPKFKAAIERLCSSNEKREPAKQFSPLQLPSARPLGRGLIAVQEEQGRLRLKDSLERSLFREASLDRRGLPSNQSLVATPERSSSGCEFSGGAPQFQR